MQDSDSDDKIQQDPVFYYSREHRLNRASQAVRELNEENTVKPGLTKTLFATKGNLFIFASILLICAMFGLASRVSRTDKSITLGGNTLEIGIRNEEGILILGIMKKAPESGESYSGPVDIAVSPVPVKQNDGEKQEAPPVFAHRIYFYPVDSETNRISLPFEGNDFLIIIRTDNELKSVQLKAAR